MSLFVYFLCIVDLDYILITNKIYGIFGNGISMTLLSKRQAQLLT